MVTPEITRHKYEKFEIVLKSLSEVTLSPVYTSTGYDYYMYDFNQSCYTTCVTMSSETTDRLTDRLTQLTSLVRVKASLLLIDSNL